MGPSVAFKLILESELKNRYNLLHLDIKANKSLESLGKWSFSKMLRNLQKYYELINILQNKKPELVLIPISQSTIGFLKDSIFIFISTCFKNKTVIQLRGGNFRNWFESTSSMMQFFIKFILKRTDAVIVQGQSLKILFESFFTDENIFVVPNGGNFILKESATSQSNSIKIIYLGNLQASKGIEDLLNAIVIIKKQAIQNFKVEVIGEWRNKSTQENCEQLVNENELPVTFHHGISGNEKHVLLHSGNLFVFTPREPEGHPWVIIEAMAAGLPIIATNKGAIAESVKDGVNGFIVPSKSPEAIAEKLRYFIENPSKRIEFGIASKNLYQSQFTENHMVENYSNVFETVLSR